MDLAKKEEDKKQQQPDKEKNVKKDKKDTKSPEKAFTMANPSILIEESTILEIESSKEVPKVTRDNSNMVLYGLPDVYLTS